jgi:hypothetical protein
MEKVLADTLISIVVASGSYYIIERPFLALKNVSFQNKQPYRDMGNTTRLLEP